MHFFSDKDEDNKDDDDDGPPLYHELYHSGIIQNDDDGDIIQGDDTYNDDDDDDDIFDEPFQHVDGTRANPQDLPIEATVHLFDNANIVPEPPNGYAISDSVFMSTRGKKYTASQLHTSRMNGGELCGHTL